MSKSTKMHIIPDELVMTKIYLIRGQKVMLDSDLSTLYKVETRRLNEQVIRNKERFPEDFMFQLNRDEYENLISQIATSSLPAGKAGWGGRRKLPYAFTEQGVAMPACPVGRLSSVLNSPTAIAVNIQIIRVFTRMRALLLTHKDMLLQLEKIEKKLGKHDEQIALVFSYLKKLLNPPHPERRRIGFRRKDEKD